MIVPNLLGGEAAVVHGIGAEGNVHGNDMNVILGGQLGGDVGAGLGHKKDGRHRNVLSGRRPGGIKFFWKTFFKVF